MVHQQGLDLGNVLQQVETIRGQRASTALNQQQLQTNVLAQQGSNQFNALLQQHIANPTPQTLNAIAAVNPQIAGQLQDVQVQQREFEREDARKTIAGIDQVLNSASPRRMAQISFPDAIETFRAQGIDIDQLDDNEFISMLTDIKTRLTPVATAEDTTVAPSTKSVFNTETGVIELRTNQEIAASPQKFVPPPATAAPDKTFENITGLRKEGAALTGKFREQGAAINRIRAVSFDKDGNVIQTPASSLALVFNFMKVLDPGSVVRESEFKTAEEARAWLSDAQEGGVLVPTFVVQAIQGLTGEGRLTREQIIDFNNNAEAIFESARTQALDDLSPIIQTAEARDFPLDRILSKSVLDSLESTRNQETTILQFDQQGNLIDG